MGTDNEGSANMAMVTQADRLLSGVLPRVVSLSIAAGVLLTGAAFALDTRAGSGAALGSALGLASLSLHSALTRMWFTQRRRRRAWAWLLWGLKWPALMTLTWWAVCRGAVDALWLCAGVGVVPAAIVTAGAWVILVEHFRRGIGAAARQR
jgi:hypothetical protein